MQLASPLKLEWRARPRVNGEGCWGRAGGGSAVSSSIAALKTSSFGPRLDLLLMIAMVGGWGARAQAKGEGEARAAPE